MSHTTNKKNKKQTKRPQQNMLNQVMSHTTNKKTNKKASTEHVKSADVTHNKQKKQKNKQKGLNRTC